jgi:hypothetical protein
MVGIFGSNVEAEHHAALLRESHRVAYKHPWSGYVSVECWVVGSASRIEELIARCEEPS